MDLCKQLQRKWMDLCIQLQRKWMDLCKQLQRKRMDLCIQLKGKRKGFVYVCSYRENRKDVCIHTVRGKTDGSVYTITEKTERMCVNRD